MREDDAVDADLTPTGQQQAATVKTDAAALHPELIVVSPLSRAIDTALIVFGKGDYICLESLRERNGLLKNGQRRTLEYLKDRFAEHDINFDNIEPGEDKLWHAFGGETLETPEACSQRAYDSLLWITRRPEKEIAIVAHGGLFHQMTNSLPDLIQCDTLASERFHNCELRTVKIEWVEDIQDGSTNSGNNSKEEKKDSDDANTKRVLKLTKLVNYKTLQ